MSYAVKRSTAGSCVATPPTTCTATVIEYACLFTHDLRRKQKRWQDGKLKLHTFNKRIMVHDERGNFIGDSHLARGHGELAEGDEVNLDRGAAIVQVCDCTGTWQQDLSEVVDKRAKEVEQRREAASAKTTCTPGAKSRVPLSMGNQGGVGLSALMTPTETRRVAKDHFQLRHLPLSAIVSSLGPTGRAVIPDRSPYEVRQGIMEQEGIGESTAKRRRVEASPPPSKAGFARNLFGTRLTLSASGAAATQPRTNAKTLFRDSVEEMRRKRVDAQVDDASRQRSNQVQRPQSPTAVDSHDSQDSTQPAPSVPTSRRPRKKSQTAPTLSKKGKAVSDKRPTSEHDEPRSQAQTVRVEPSSHVAKHMAQKTASGPRAELRINPRPRKRLLLVSQKQQGTLRASNHICRQETSRRLGHDGQEARKALDEKRMGKRSRASPTTSCIELEEEENVHVDYDDDDDCQESSASQKSASNGDESDTMPITSTHRRLRPRRREGRVEESSEDDKEPMVPRVVKLGGKSTRSKEMIGFVFPGEESLVPAAFAAATERIGSGVGVGCRPGGEGGGERDKTRNGGIDAKAEARRLEHCSLGKEGGGHEVAMEAGDEATELAKAEQPRTDGPMTCLGREALAGGNYDVGQEEMGADVASPGADMDSARADMASSRLGGQQATLVTWPPLAAMEETLPVQEKAKHTNSGKAKQQRQQDAKRQQDERITNSRQQGKLGNPATRGKKAARKDDAAGQMPQSLVPLERASASSVWPLQRASDGVPGFTKANGGAWSKHALDLLGMARPVEKEMG